MVKGVFGTHTLTEIHSSLNNVDKLRTLIHQIQKDLHPYGQDIQGVIHAFQQNENGIRDYLQRICMYATIIKLNFNNLFNYYYLTLILFYSIF